MVKHHLCEPLCWHRPTRAVTGPSWTSENLTGKMIILFVSSFHRTSQTRIIRFACWWPRQQRGGRKKHPCDSAGKEERKLTCIDFFLYLIYICIKVVPGHEATASWQEENALSQTSTGCIWKCLPEGSGGNETPSEWKCCSLKILKVNFLFVSIFYHLFVCVIVHREESLQRRSRMSLITARPRCWRVCAWWFVVARCVRNSRCLPCSSPTRRTTLRSSSLKG